MLCIVRVSVIRRSNEFEKLITREESATSIKEFDFSHRPPLLRAVTTPVSAHST